MKNSWMPKDEYEQTGKPIEVPSPNKSSGLAGWHCPKCGNVYSPFTPECRNCNKSEYPITPPTWC